MRDVPAKRQICKNDKDKKRTMGQAILTASPAPKHPVSMPPGRHIDPKAHAGEREVRKSHFRVQPRSRGT
jgi:hypothetical protein